MLEENLISYLLADTDISSFTGNRIFPGRRPQASELPAVTLTRIYGERMFSDTGYINLTESRFDVDIWSTKYSETKLLTRAVAERLKTIEPNFANTDVQAMFLEDERDFNESGSNNFEYLYRTNLEIILIHRE